jgi:hypothetical protein
VVLLDGFYEWKQEGGAKQPYHVSTVPAERESKEGGAMFAAGLYDCYRGERGAAEMDPSCRAPQALGSRFHSSESRGVGSGRVWGVGGGGEGARRVRPHHPQASRMRLRSTP